VDVDVDEDDDDADVSSNKDVVSDDSGGGSWEGVSTEREASEGRKDIVTVEGNVMAEDRNDSEDDVDKEDDNSDDDDDDDDDITFGCEM
jgi:hypothetical protein